MKRPLGMKDTRIQGILVAEALPPAAALASLSLLEGLQRPDGRHQAPALRSFWTLGL